MPLKCSSPLVLGGGILIFQVIQLFGSDTLANPGYQTIMAKGQKITLGESLQQTSVLAAVTDTFPLGKYHSKQKNQNKTKSLFIITKIIEQLPGQGMHSGILLSLQIACRIFNSCRIFKYVSPTFMLNNFLKHKEAYSGHQQSEGAWLGRILVQPKQPTAILTI